jgi:hypothetical protein
MKALSYCKPLYERQKKISCRQIYWEENILRCTFTGKKYLSCFPGRKKIIAQSESSNPPQKSNGPPLMSLHWVIVIVWLG